MEVFAMCRSLVSDYQSRAKIVFMKDSHGDQLDGKTSIHSEGILSKSETLQNKEKIAETAGNDETVSIKTQEFCSDLLIYSSTFAEFLKDEKVGDLVSGMTGLSQEGFSIEGMNDERSGDALRT